VDPRGREDDAVRVVRNGVGSFAIERLTFVVELAEVRLVLRVGSIRVLRALPGGVDVDVDKHREGMLAQRVLHLGRLDGAAAERHDAGGD